MREAIVSRAREAAKSLGRAYASDEAFKGAVPVAAVLLMLLVTLWLTQALDAFASPRTMPMVPESLPGTRRSDPGTHRPFAPVLLAPSMGQQATPFGLDHHVQPPVLGMTPGPVDCGGASPTAAWPRHLLRRFA